MRFWKRRGSRGRSLKVTRSGRIFLLWVLGVGIAALNTGNNLLYLVLGLMLSAIVASGVLSERTLRGLRVRRLPVDAAFAGEPFPFRWAVSRERGTSFALSFRELGSGFQTEADGRLGAVAAGAERTVRGTLRASHRGPLALARLEVTTLFPLGLFAKTRIFALTDTVLIFPRQVEAPRVEARRAEPLGDGGARRGRDGGGDLLGLRELSPGEDARRVHWLRSAAAGKPLRTEREEEQRRQVTLDVDAALTGEALERALEVAAARAARLLGAGTQVGLSAGQRRVRPGSGAAHHRRILSALAFVGREDRP